METDCSLPLLQKIAQDRPNHQSSSFSKLKCPNDLKKPGRGLLSASFLIFCPAGRYIPSTRDNIGIYRDILKYRDIFKISENVAINRVRYIAGVIKSRYIAMSAIYRRYMQLWFNNLILLLHNPFYFIYCFDFPFPFGIWNTNLHLHVVSLMQPTSILKWKDKSYSAFDIF